MPLTPDPSGLPGSVLRMARPSTVDLIAAELRAAIFSGALSVGSPLGEVDIASQLGVSRGPLREAAQRLVQEGVLTALPGRGLRVSVIAVDGIPDLYRARRAVEREAVRILARSGSGRVVAELESSLADLERASESADAMAIGDADIAFHQALVDAAGSPRLSRAMVTLALETRIASFSSVDGYTVPAAVSPTYARMIRAVGRGDVEDATAALDDQFDDAVARLTGRRDFETVETGVIDVPPVLGRIDLVDG